MNVCDLLGVVAGAITSLSAVWAYIVSGSTRKTFFPMALDLRLLYLAVAGVMAMSAAHWLTITFDSAATDHLETIGVVRWWLIAGYFGRVAYGLHKTQLEGHVWAEFRDIAMTRLNKFVEKTP